MATCPYCAEEISRTATVCPHCNSELDERPSRSARRAPAKKNSSTSVLLIVLLVLGVGGLGCAGVLAALLLPAVQQAREAARRSQSRNNLKQIGLAMHNYHDTMRVFPPGGVFDEAGNGYHGWNAMLLPYMEYGFLYNQIDFHQPWDAPVNSATFQNAIPAYLMPGEEEMHHISGYPVSHYTGNSRALGPNSSLQFREVTDGTSNTILAGEAAGNYLPWGDPRNYRDPAKGINAGPDSFGSRFRGGSHLLMMDGYVRFVNENIDPTVLEALATPDGGEVVGEF